MKHYKHIFFDLDRTLWDFETNSKNTLLEIVEEFELLKHGVPSAEEFISVYRIENEKLWDEYRVGKIHKDFLRSERFLRSMKHFDIDSKEIAEQIGFYYVNKSPEKKALFPHTHELLQSLVKSGITLHIITNGFEEVQAVKLKNCDLRSYFDHVITSEKAGVKKPDPAIFNYALGLANAKPEESLMVGDDVKVDLLGAKNVGIDQAYFNPHDEVHSAELTIEYKDHRELINWILSEEFQQ